MYNCEIDNFLGIDSEDNISNATMYIGTNGLMVWGGSSRYINRTQDVNSFLESRGYSNVSGASFRWNPVTEGINTGRAYVTYVFEDGSEIAGQGTVNLSNISSPLTDAYIELETERSIEILFSGTEGSETVASSKVYPINISAGDGETAKFRTIAELANTLVSIGFAVDSTSLGFDATPVIRCENAVTGETGSTTITISNGEALVTTTNTINSADEQLRTLFTSLEGLYGEIRQLNDELHQLSDQVGANRNNIYNLTNRVDNCCGIDE